MAETLIFKNKLEFQEFNSKHGFEYNGVSKNTVENIKLVLIDLIMSEYDLDNNDDYINLTELEKEEFLKNSFIPMVTEEAIETLNELVFDDYDNTNCWECLYCEECESCDNCYDSHGCKNCNYLISSENSKKCDGLHFNTIVNVLKGVVNYSETSFQINGCENCKQCIDCENCKDCNECTNCEQCTSCLKCFECSGCKCCAVCEYVSNSDKCVKCKLCDKCVDCNNVISETSDRISDKEHFYKHWWKKEFYKHYFDDVENNEEPVEPDPNPGHNTGSDDPTEHSESDYISGMPSNPTNEKISNFITDFENNASTGNKLDEQILSDNFDGSGTQNDPYLIQNSRDLGKLRSISDDKFNDLRNTLNNGNNELEHQIYFKQTCDINVEWDGLGLGTYLYIEDWWYNNLADESFGGTNDKTGKRFVCYGNKTIQDFFNYDGDGYSITFTNNDTILGLQFLRHKLYGCDPDDFGTSPVHSTPFVEETKYNITMDLCFMRGNNIKNLTVVYDGIDITRDDDEKHMTFNLYPILGNNVTNCTIDGFNVDSNYLSVYVNGRYVKLNCYGIIGENVSNCDVKNCNNIIE